MPRVSITNITSNLLLALVFSLYSGQLNLAAANVLNTPQEIEDISKFSHLKDNNTGAAIYAVPIITPPGIGKIKPELTLNYNSHNQKINSWLGVSWDLVIGSISRSTKWGIDYSASDFVVENPGGKKEIVLVDSTSGSYKPILDKDFTKYNFTTGQSWLATTRDGTKLFYGSTGGSRLSGDGGVHVYKWCLDRVEDPNGNYMTITYVQHDGQIYPSQIAYSGNVSGYAPNNTITFHLEDRIDAYKKYNTNYPVKTAKRLKAIVVESAGISQSVYRLLYKDSIATGRSLLESVIHYGKGTEVDANGEIVPDTGVALPPIEFTWQDAETTYMGPFGWGSYIEYNDPAHCNKNLVDMDSNGVKEVVSNCSGWLSKAHIDNSVKFSNGPIVDWKGHPDYEGPFGTNTFKNLLGKFADLNADGKTDKIDIDYYNNNTHYVSLSDGTSFTPVQPWSASTDNSFFAENKVFTGFTDLNGDGRADHVYIAKNGNHYVSISTGAGYDTTSSPWTGVATNMDQCSSGIFVDINGDGKSDFLGQIRSYGSYDWNNERWVCDGSFQYYVLMSTGSGYVKHDPWYVHGHSGEEVPLDQPGDVNGDGKMDFVDFQPSSGQHKVFLSNGTDGFVVEIWPTTPFAGGDPNLAGLVDFSGPTDFYADGKADFYFTDPRSGYNSSLNYDYLYISKGNGFKVVADYRAATWGYTTEYADLTGNGNPDRFSDLAQDYPYPNAYGYYTDLVGIASSVPDYIESIDNGLGRTINLIYLPSSTYSSEIKILPNIYQLLARVIVDDGLGSSYTTTYEYQGGLLDIPTREFRGFEFVTKFNQDYSKVITQYHQDYFFKGKPIVKELYDNTDVLLKKEAFTWDKSVTGEIIPASSLVYSWLFTNTYFVKLAEKQTTLYDTPSNPASSNEVYTYYDSDNTPLDLTDDHGLVKSKTASGTNGDNVIYNYQYINKGELDGWLWRLKEESIYGKKTVQSDGDVRKTTYNYAPDTGNLLSKEFWWEEKDAGGSNPKIEYVLYDEYGNLRKEKDAKGNITEYVIDPASHALPVKIISPSTGGVVHEIEYPAYDYQCGKPTQFIDENDQSTFYAYDDFCRLSQTDYPDGGQEIKEYYDFDYVNSLPSLTLTSTKEKASDDCTVSGNCIESYEYFDGLNRLVQTVSFGENSKPVLTRLYYDEMGRNDLIDGPFFGVGVEYLVADAPNYPAAPPWTQSYYDYLGRVIEQRTADAFYGTLIASYEHNGLETTVTDPDNRKKKEVKDFAGQLREVVEYVENGVTQHTYYDYNAAGDLLTVEDALNNITTINYDTLGRKTSMDDPDMGFWQYTYDSNDNLETQTDARDIVTTFDYDVLSRLLGKTYTYPAGYTGSLTPPATYTYDTTDGFSSGAAVPNAIGRLTSADNIDVNTTYDSYDEMGRLTAVSKTIAGDATTYTSQYQYDLSGKTTGITFPDSYQLLNSYYPGSNLLSTVEGESDLKVFATLTDYESSGKIGRVEYGNGVVTDYQYDPQSQRLTSLATGSYAGAADIQDKSYTYSPAGDIETITDSIKTVTYSYYYDFLHRLKAETAEGDITIIPKLEVTFDHIGPGPVHAAKSTTIGGVDYLYEYDINGNMISGPDMTDPKNVLTREISFNAENMPVDINGGQVNITYDADNVRAAKTGGSSTFYINSDYEVIDGVGTKYIFAGNQRIAKITDQTLNYFHQDHLGSASVVSEAETPTIVEAAEYLPFGMTRSANAITTTNYQFTDQEKDSEINLYNYDARLYDPAAGFFISADSIVPDFADPQSLNRYAYVLNNPLIYTDPSGNYWQEEDEGFFEYEGPSISDNTGRDQFLDSISLYQDGTKLSFLPLDSTNLHLETPFMDPVDAVLMFTGVYGLAKGVSQLGLKGLLLPLQNQVGGFIRKGASKNVVNFGQLNVKSTFAHGPFKGQSIANVAKGLRSGRISPNQLPVDYIVRNGERVALNNRSLTALRRAGIEPTKLFDRTGITRFEKLLDSHLGGGATSDFIRIRGAASGTSLIN